MMNLVEKIAICLALVIAFSTQAMAQDLDCTNPSNTYEIGKCLSDQMEVADNELNIIYSQVRADQDEKGSLLLRDAQRAWIKFRDAECNRVSDAARGGTLAGTLHISCKLEHTLTRTTALATNPMTGEEVYLNIK